MAVELFFNNYLTTTVGGVSATATAIQVASAAEIASVGESGGYQTRIAVENELMLVTGINSGTLYVVRGIEGTVAAAHTNGTVVYGVLTAQAVAYALPLSGGVLTPTTGPTTYGMPTTVEIAQPTPGYVQLVVGGGSGINVDQAVVDIGAGGYGQAIAAAGEVDIGNGGYTDPSPGVGYDLKCGGPNGGITCLGAINADQGYLADNVVVIDGTGQIYDQLGNTVLDVNGNLVVYGYVGFYGTAAIPRPTVTGSRASGAALVSLLTALANLGLIINSTTT